MLAVEIILTVLAILAAASTFLANWLTRRDLQRLQQTEDRIDDQLHAIHEAMLLWNYGDRAEAMKLLAEHDVFVKDFSRG